jgi:hypothetical protein
MHTIGCLTLRDYYIYFHYLTLLWYKKSPSCGYNNESTIYIPEWSNSTWSAGNCCVTHTYRKFSLQQGNFGEVVILITYKVQPIFSTQFWFVSAFDQCLWTLTKDAAIIYILTDGRIQWYFTSNFPVILTRIWNNINTGLMSFYRNTSSNKETQFIIRIVMLFLECKRELSGLWWE